MRHEQLEHAIRAACQIVGQTEVIIVGSQAILASFADDQLPAEATMSAEIDILPIANSSKEVEALADLLYGTAGEFSSFEQLHGFSIDGVDLSTCILHEDWRSRLIKVQNRNTAPPSGHPQFTGWCLERHDLCVAKLCAFRPKDRNFVAALLRTNLVSGNEIKSRLADISKSHPEKARVALAWLADWVGG